MKTNGSQMSRRKTNSARTNGVKTKRSRPRRDAGTDWGKLRRRSAASIRKGIAADPDVHGTDAAFWKSAKVVMPTPKEIVTMRLDADLLRWFRQQRGYQTRINAILRAYMQAHESSAKVVAGSGYKRKTAPIA